MILQVTLQVRVQTTLPADCGVTELFGNPSTGVRETFSRAAVVIVEDVGVLMPFMTRSCATSGLLAVEGLRAFTTSFTALAWLFCRIIFLIGFAHRGSTVRGEDGMTLYRKVSETDHQVFPGHRDPSALVMRGPDPHRMRVQDGCEGELVKVDL